MRRHAFQYGSVGKLDSGFEIRGASKVELRKYKLGRVGKKTNRFFASEIRILLPVARNSFQAHLDEDASWFFTVRFHPMMTMKILGYEKGFKPLAGHKSY